MIHYLNSLILDRLSKLVTIIVKNKCIYEDIIVKKDEIFDEKEKLKKYLNFLQTEKNKILEKFDN
jgi:hypothetical protein